MDGSTLGIAIEKLAGTKATDHIRKIHAAIALALKPFWRQPCHSGMSHNEDFHKKTNNQILEEFHRASVAGSADYFDFGKIDRVELEKYFTSTILEEVLVKLPLVKQLSQLADLDE